MKGIILGGGTGSRLAPLTKSENKHLLPVYNKRMIEYPIRTLVDAGIKDIILITGGNKPGAFLELLKNGKDHGIDRLYYTYQEGSGGIADALKLAEQFMEGSEPCVVILGDNYFEKSIKQQLVWWNLNRRCRGAGILVRQTSTPWHFGIAEVENGKVISIEEKPSNPKSDLAILGCYFFDYRIWEILPELQQSSRGELEITDALKVYMLNDELTPFNYFDYWSDMGTFETWTEVSQRVARTDGNSSNR